MRTEATRAARARFDQSAQHRRAMIAKIHVAQKQLAMDEDDYRQGLFEATGKTSLRECCDVELAAVLDWLNRLGFSPLQSRRGVAQHPMARKARALWISLHHLGVVHNPGEPALEAFARRQLGCDKLQWARQSDAARLIEALKAMAERAGWAQADKHGRPLGPIELQHGLCLAILARMKAAGMVPADWLLHEAMWRLCGVENARERGWDRDDYARLAAAMGRRLRDAGGLEQGAENNG